MSHEILIRPLVTEKLSGLMEKGYYTFVVRINANKIEIQKAVVERFPGVQVAHVRTMIVRGKRRRQFVRGGVRMGSTARYKKAIVRLASDSAPIDFYEAI